MRSEVSSQITIALDAMSGDYGPKVVTKATKRILKKYNNVVLVLVGNERVLKSQAKSLGILDHKNVRFVNSSEVVRMSDNPIESIRSKKGSSMRVAINLVKNGEVNACVSSGNTGALMAMAHFVLRTIKGISRPAIVKEIPCISDKKKHIRMLDLGANVDSSAEQLEQFAIMGSILSNSVDGVENPSVALLNIGKESFKGNAQVKKTADLLKNNELINYVGFIEGDEILNGKADVIVCDGFVGNVALKTIEGVAKNVKKLLLSSFFDNPILKYFSFIKFVIKPFLTKFDPSLHNGASLLGLNGIVIKSHGNTTAKGFESAIEEAIIQTRYNLPGLVRNKLSEIMSSKEKIK